MAKATRIRQPMTAVVELAEDEIRAVGQWAYFNPDNDLVAGIAAKVKACAKPVRRAKKRT